MNYVTLLILTILVSSCSGTKNAIENQPTQTNEVAVLTKAPNVVEVPTPTKPSKETETKVKTLEQPKIEESKVIETKKISVFNHSVWNTLLEKNVSEDGKVNYKGFKTNSTELHAYIDALTNNIPNENWSKEDKLAYWINAYNALTVDLILKNYPLKSIKDIKDPWEQRFWKFGDTWQNLSDIEHKILRNMHEPRIHFAIVCASVSCPKLQNEAFTASNLDAQLTNATQEFLSDPNRNEISENSIKISKIFQWFKKDFEQDGSLIDFLNKYSPVEISAKAKKKFKDYNWNLNE